MLIWTVERLWGCVAGGDKEGDDSWQWKRYDASEGSGLRPCSWWVPIFLSSDEMAMTQRTYRFQTVSHAIWMLCCRLSRTKDRVCVFACLVMRALLERLSGGDAQASGLRPGRSQLNLLRLVCVSLHSPFVSKQPLFMPGFQSDVEMNVVTKANSPATIAMLQASIISMILAVPRLDARVINWFYDTDPARMPLSQTLGIRSLVLGDDK
jgi:hypothetical protein